jgi:hypothetical protein
MLDGEGPEGGREEAGDAEGVLEGDDAVRVLDSAWKGREALRVRIARCKRLRVVDVRDWARCQSLQVDSCIRLQGVSVGEELQALVCRALPRLTALSFHHTLRQLVVEGCPGVAESLKLGLICAPWPHLRELSISDVPLHPLPVDGLESPRLEVLRLCGAGLSLVPREWVARNTAVLRELDLSRNSLPNIPPFVFEMTSLEALSLSDNPVSSLPKSVGRLTKLRSLKLERCALQGVPVDVLSEMLTLSEFELMGNPLREFRIDSFGATVEFQAELLAGADAVERTKDPRGAIAGLFDPRLHVRHTSAGPPAVARDELG